MQGYQRHGVDRHYSADRFRFQYVGNKPNVIIFAVSFIFLLGLFLYIWAAMLGTIEPVSFLIEQYIENQILQTCC